MRRASLVIVLAGSLAWPAAGGSVERRGVEPALTGAILPSDIDEAGVRVKSESGATHRVPWDRVRRVEPDRPVRELDQLMVTATEIWRARSRVERGDTALAEPLLERLFEQFRGRTHETALVVAEGLLRCRLARGANARAVIPALEVARMRLAGVATDSYHSLRPVIDDETLLGPRLAPAWVHSRALPKLERDLANYDAQGDRVVESLAALYLRAARQHLGLETVPEATARAALAREHPGVRCLHDVVACNAADAEVRRAARQALGREVGDRPAWVRAWARFALGTSLLRESGLGPQQRGMVSLLHVPARFARVNPFLAGLALAWSVAGSREHEDLNAAAALADELERRFPNHPARAVGDPVRLDLLRKATH